MTSTLTSLSINPEQAGLDEYLALAKAQIYDYAAMMR